VNLARGHPECCEAFPAVQQVSAKPRAVARLQVATEERVPRSAARDGTVPRCAGRDALAPRCVAVEVEERRYGA